MQKFILKRKYRKNEATLGTIFTIKGKEICKTLENRWHKNKNIISCIPEGVYKVVADNKGKFKYWQILDVKNRDNIEIHQGNLEKDTRGCIIIGKKWGFIKDELAVLSSRVTIDKLKQNKILPDKFYLKITE